MNHAVAALRSHGGNLSLSQLARSLTMSEKHFQRLFKQSVGVTAKRFQRLARFELTIRHLLLHHSRVGALSIILENGYYDQSHFCREFHEFIRSRPGDFLKDDQYMSFFYNLSADESFTIRP